VALFEEARHIDHQVPDNGKADKRLQHHRRAVDAFLPMTAVRRTSIQYIQQGAPDDAGPPEDFRIANIA
jgi:hypothetical protein